MDRIKLLVLVNLVLVVIGEENNVCSSYKGYYNVTTNQNCWYNLAAHSSLQEVIETSGYQFEEHKVTTKDGFILTLFRIPNDKHPNPKKNPVFLQHGIEANAACFFGLGKNSLAFILADAGYDVWVGNWRGTRYSEEHINLTVKDKKFWDHSMDELGLLDIPAMINYVRKQTKNVGKILYVGHSLGSTLGMIYGSSMPKNAAKNIKLFVFMAPAHKLTHMISPIHNFEPILGIVYEFLSSYDLERLTSQSSNIRMILKLICTENPKIMSFCMNIFNLIFGPFTQIGPESVPVIFNFLPGGTSIKVFRHAFSTVRNVFQKYDYGAKNMEVYGQHTPPHYDVKNIQVPVYLVYASNDWLTPKVDAEIFYYSLRNESKYGLYEIPGNFNHMDFLFSRNAKELLYNQLLKVLHPISKDPN